MYFLPTQTVSSVAIPNKNNREKILSVFAHPSGRCFAYAQHDGKKQTLCEKQPFREILHCVQNDRKKHAPFLSTLS